MKKRSFYQILMTVVMTLTTGIFTGCTKDLDVGMSTNPIMFAIDNDGFNEMKTVTRGAKVSTVSTVGVCASVYSSSSSYTSAGCGSFFYNQQVTSGLPTEFFWPTSDYKLSFFGYYPKGNAAFTLQSTANTTGAPTYAYTVPSAIADQVDVMTCQNVNILGGGSSPVGLTMKHRCAAICFSVTNSRLFAVTLTSVSIEGVKYSGTLNEETWTLASAVNSSSSNPFTLAYGSSIASGATVDVTGTTNIFLMLPQTIPAGAKVKVSIAGEDPLYTNLSGIWAAGKQYNYNLDIQNNTITIVDENTGVEDWAIDFVDLGLPSGTLWAKGNIVSDGNGGYKIGAETDYGAYFSWGNVDPHFSSNGYSFDNRYSWGSSCTGSPYAGSAGASISYTSTTYGRDYPANTTNDAARACLGGNWQVPTYNQFLEMFMNTDKEWTTISGVNGYKFMKKTDHSVYVFFPAGGRGEILSLSERGEWGYYWSSSLYYTTIGYCMTFYNRYADSSGEANLYKGLSVRAVQ